MNPVTENISPETFAASREFIALTGCEREWVLAYLSNGRDAEAAVRSAYPGVKDLNRFCSRVQNNPKIIAAIELWDGVDERTSAIRGLERDIRSLRGMARVNAKKLLFKLKELI